MAQWFRINSDLLYCLEIQKLPPRVAMEKFMAATRGENNEFRPFIRFGDRIPANEWRELRSQVFARDNYTCQYCGERGGRLECDHSIPHSRGGSDDLSNLVTACRKCNRSKRDKTPEEWREANGAH